MSQHPEEPTSADELDSTEEQYDEVYTAEVDPDLDAARDLNAEREEDALTTERLLPEENLTEYEPPDDPSTPTALGETELDEEIGETIDDRIAQEEPEEEP